jgi:hypothetical protein
MEAIFSAKLRRGHEVSSSSYLVDARDFAGSKAAGSWL